jgi:hypothetical protein
VVGVFEVDENGCESNAEGRDNTLELNIWHVGLRSWIQEGHQGHDWEPGLQAPVVWDEQWGVGVGGAVVRSFEGKHFRCSCLICFRELPVIPATFRGSKCLAQDMEPFRLLDIWPRLIFSQIFKDAILFFSRSTPNLAQVIPAMDHIDHILTTHSIDNKYQPAIRAALGLAKKTLNRYYNLTDDSEVYRIAMSTFLFTQIPACWPFVIVLHPRHKLAYFKKAGWPQEWIDTAEQILRDEFNHSYPIINTSVDDGLATEAEDDDGEVPVPLAKKVCILLAILLLC